MSLPVLGSSGLEVLPTPATMKKDGSDEDGDSQGENEDAALNQLNSEPGDSWFGTCNPLVSDDAKRASEEDDA